MDRYFCPTHPLCGKPAAYCMARNSDCISDDTSTGDYPSCSKSSTSSAYSRRNCTSVNAGGCTSATSCSSGSCSSSCSCGCVSYADPPRRIQPPLKPLKTCGPWLQEWYTTPFDPKEIRRPKWITHGGLILKFFAYYQESIFFSALETYRVHHCEILYYLEDDTIEVVEPKTIDPGYEQGRVISRSRIPLPSPCEESLYTLDHLTVGCEVELYGKVFHIEGCDDVTRRWLNREGYRVAPNQPLPQDPATELRKEIHQAQFARKAGFNLEALRMKQFLDHNGQVLRFWAYWVDEAGNLETINRKFVLHYFLVDDTIEIVEQYEANSGYEPHPVFLNRGKLLKDFKKLHNIVGVREEALGVLNIAGTAGDIIKANNYVNDRLCPGIEELESYKACDLAIGGLVNVYGRPFILVSCDEFTKRYYRDKYGVQDFTPLEIPDDGSREVPEPVAPPYNGIGDEEDTLANWNKLEPRPHRKDDLLRMIRENDILNFAAQLDKPLHKVNSDRRFTIKYYLADGSIKILEKPHRNTGFPAGTFLKRNRIKVSNNDSELRYIGPEDLYIGNTITINGFIFKLMDADEFSLSLMEKYSDLFQHSNICPILAKVREAFGPLQAQDVLLAFSDKDSEKMGIQDAMDFRGLIMHLTKYSLSEQEVMTLIRAYRVEHPEVGPDLETLQVVIQSEMARFNFDKCLLERVKHSFCQYDACCTGMIDRSLLRKVLKGSRLPVDLALIDFLVDNFPAGDHCDRVSYCDVVSFLDWENCRSAVAFPTPTPCVWKYVSPKPPREINCVNYRALLDDVCPNIKCALPAVCCPPSCPEEQFCYEEAEDGDSCQADG